MTIKVHCTVSVLSLSSALEFVCDHLYSINHSNTRSKQLLKKWLRPTLSAINHMGVAVLLRTYTEHQNIT